MELASRDRLSELVEELTMSGEPELNQDKMKEVKRICKGSNEYIDHVYHSVMSQLNEDHAEIRLSAFQIASELFSRSHHFRTLLVENFQDFLELTVETDSGQPLPPPKEVARKLKTLAIRTVQSWHASFGTAYKKLALGYHFLKQIKVDFHDVQARTTVERRREEERLSRMEIINSGRAEAAAKELEEFHQEIESTLTEMESCLKLLLPDEFCLLDHQMNISTSQSSQPADQHSPPLQATAPTANDEMKDLKPFNECTSEQKQPCCSQDLKRAGKDGEEREQKKRNEKVEEKKKLNENNTLKERGDEEGRNERKMKLEDDMEDDSFIQHSGLISHSYSLDISLDPEVYVKETEDNEAVVSTLIDLHRLITTKHLPAVQSWVQIFTKSGAEQQLRRALDLKMSLEDALQKHKKLHISYKTRIRRVMKASAAGGDEEEESDDQDDFTEVPEKEGYEPNIPEHLREEYGLDSIPSTSSAPTNKRAPSKRPVPPASTFSSYVTKQRKRVLEEEQDPTCAAATQRQLLQHLSPHTAPGTSSSTQSRAGAVHAAPLDSGPGASCLGGGASASEDKAANAPVVPFGLDLYYWGQDQPNAGKIIKSASQHQFWVPCEVDEEVENKELSAESRSRYISFPGTFTPVSHYCSAPLANGKLCQRQDRVKCPFHGVIVPRDAQGRPIREEDRQREEQEERKRREEQPDWRDLELMQDIEAATGEDLSSGLVGRGRGQNKGKGKKKKKYPNLSDLKQSSNTPRSRLERKVFNKSSMRRVTEAQNKADSRKHDKFSNQFNYALN
ncbi:UV-stimulated scaffold protein A isoform X2 [Lampris incognitus]|uniref:UV-stimulated scaffold protein A isoform X2 n=1 Tax=Lampris incognitus TaxID=2546036 RepID=UPI0024B59470|nr:UV-stimulated scaffold protein A isoform X2 [Lampris incognitus]